MRLGSRFEKAFKGLLAYWAARLGSKSSGPGFQFRPGLSTLILRPDRLGDLILSAPALQLLEEASGGCGHWTLVTGPRNEEAARFFFPEARVWVARKNLFSRLGLVSRLVRNSFDLTLDLHSFPFSVTSSLMTLLSGSPARVGFLAEGECHELSRKVFNLGVPEPDPFQHESEKTLALMEPLGFGKVPEKVPVLKVPALSPEVEPRVESFFRMVGGGPNIFRVGLHPTLQKADNRWSQSRYLELIELLSRVKGLQVILIYGKGEERELRDFLAGLGPRSHVFTLPENDLLFILGAARRLDLLVCNDSGLMHWGALVTQVLAMFGPSEPRQWAPLAVGKGRPKILRKSDKLCDSILPQEVAKEIQRRMSASRR